MVAKREHLSRRLSLILNSEVDHVISSSILSGVDAHRRRITDWLRVSPVRSRRTEAYQLIPQTGADYYSTLVAPYVTSSARKVVGRYSPEEIYSSKREQIEREIREEVSQKLATKHVQVNAVLIREVHLPPAVQAAIQTKLEEEQKALEMQFVLERTKQARSGAQAHRSVGHSRLSGDYQQRIAQSGHRMEGNRGHGKAGGVPQRQGNNCGLWERRATGNLEHCEFDSSAGRQPIIRGSLSIQVVAWSGGERYGGCPELRLGNALTGPSLRLPCLVETLMTTLSDSTELIRPFYALTDFRRENRISAKPNFDVNDALRDMIRLEVHAFIRIGVGVAIAESAPTTRERAEE
jgi:hypothetical protein